MERTKKERRMFRRKGGCSREDIQARRAVRKEGIFRTGGCLGRKGI
jgi:hypothetical protein